MLHFYNVYLQVNTKISYVYAAKIFHLLGGFAPRPPDQ